jgi:quinol monooxygenase YgiN
MPSPIIVIARARIQRPERETFLKALRICIGETRREPGCIRYDMHESVTDPEQFAFVEEWRDRAAIEGGERWRIL